MLFMRWAATENNCGGEACHAKTNRLVLPAMIGITFALPQESSAFLRRLHSKRFVVRGALPVIEGQVDKCCVIVCHTGIGARSTLKRIEAFLENVELELLISSGYAGALTSRFSVGDTVVAENCSLIRIVNTLGRDLPRAKLVTVQTVVETPAAKAKLRAETGGEMVDMESAIIFGACENLQIPMITLRAISDAANETTPIPFHGCFEMEKQALRLGGIVRFLAAHPGAIFPLVRFARRLGPAKERLALALLNVIADWENHKDVAEKI
jgi:adenosylhomocysteine nucleosidase